MPTLADRLAEVHGTEDCYICGHPRRLPHPKLSICSYPHGMLPIEAIDPVHPEGFWSWANTNDKLK